MGPFVDSHLIPKALTTLSRSGEKYVEAGIGHRILRRPGSWYDSHLVTREGEDVLARIDSKAIKELRRLRLVWSGWDGATRLPTEDLVLEKGKPAYRIVEGAQATALQLFFISLLWRAGATTLPQFSRYVRIGDKFLEDVRLRVLAEDPGGFSDYPIHLFQIVDQGEMHNRTPLLERKRVPKLDGSLGESIDYVRFYFDGLIAHVHLALHRSLPQPYLQTCLGPSGRLTVLTHNFDDSRARENLREIALAAHVGSWIVPWHLKPIIDGLHARWPRPLAASSSRFACATNDRGRIERSDIRRSPPFDS